MTKEDPNKENLAEQTPRKAPTKEEFIQMQTKSMISSFQNVFDQSLGRADGILRDAVRMVIQNAVTKIMQVQNENEKLRNENNELRSKLANIEGSKLPKTPVKVKTRK